MKNLFTFLLFLLLYRQASTQSSCDLRCPIPGVNWPAYKCEHYEYLHEGDDLLTTDWKLYPSSSGYNPIPATIKVKRYLCDGCDLFLNYTCADFTDPRAPVDNYYLLGIVPQDYRFSFGIHFDSGQSGHLVLKNSNLGIDVLTLDFNDGTATIKNSNYSTIGSFKYPNNVYFNMNLFYHYGNGSLEIFRSDYKVANITGLGTSTSTWPSIMNFYAKYINDGFCLGGVCLVTHKVNNVICTQDFHPQCLNGTNEPVGNNSCYAGINGYTQNETHDCSDSGNKNPCDDCDECFTYRFDCSDPRMLYLINNYCDESTPQFTNSPKEGQSVTEYEWEFRNANNIIFQPEYLFNTNYTSRDPICRIPSSGTYTCCFKVYKYQENGRYLAYTCCYSILVALPCKNTPTLFINSGSVSSNNEITFNPITSDASNFSWRCGNANAYIPNQSTTSQNFKCKFPSGVNCMTVCLTVGNACGMISKCITVCNSNSGCGSKPASHPPITYQISQTGEVSFNNIPQMDTYSWTIPSGCTFTGGTNGGSRSPTCKIPDINCSYIFCVKMKIDCYVCCYCFTIKRGGSSGPITFDPDEMSCAPPNTGVKVPVRVKGFSKISSVDFEISLNPTNVAKFEGAELGPNIDPSSIFAPLVKSNSRIRIGWAGDANNPTTLQDNDIFCYLLLTTIGATNSSATITIDASNPQIFQNNSLVTPILNTGSICINGTFNICGHISTEDNRNVKDVEVTISGNVTNTTKTNAQGDYCFNNIPAGTYSIKPRKTLLPGNGVGFQDIAYLKGHLLGTGYLSSPYRIIAADADNSRSLTATDISRIIPTIQDSNRVFANVDSWRFIPKAYTFPNVLNPFQSAFPEIISVTVNNGNVNNQDFTGIKIGDLDLNNNPQRFTKEGEKNLKSIELNSRSTPSIDLKVNKYAVKPDANIKVPVYAKGFDNVTSFGFSMSWQQLKIQFIGLSNFNDKLKLTNGNFNLTEVAKGKLGVVWYVFTNGISLAENEPLFYIEFKAIGKDAEVSPISFTTTPTPISFANDIETFQVNLIPGEIKIDQNAVAVKEVEKEKSGFSIYPNPVNNKLMINNEELDLSQAELKVSAIDGRLFELPIQYSNTHLIQLNVGSLAAGTYQLKIITGQGSQSIRFVKI